MRCFISLDFSGGRNPSQTVLHKRGLISSQNWEGSRSSKAGLTGPQVSAGSSPSCFLCVTSCFPAPNWLPPCRGKEVTANPKPTQAPRGIVPCNVQQRSPGETPRSLTLVTCPPTPRAGRGDSSGHVGKTSKLPKPQFPHLKTRITIGPTSPSCYED